VVEKLWCAVTIDVDCHHLLRDEGTLQKAYIFLQPVSLTQYSTRIGLDFPESDQVYWSLDPTGNVRMTQDECDRLGLPRLQFRFLPVGRFWHEYQYNAIRELFQTKNFDPHSYDVTRLLGLPLAEIESNIPPSMFNVCHPVVDSSPHSPHRPTSLIPLNGALALFCIVCTDSEYFTANSTMF
jgi:hypothetical protein